MFYATQEIRRGEEIFFNYDETGKLAECFDWAGEQQPQTKEEVPETEKSSEKKHRRGRRPGGKKKRKVELSSSRGSDSSIRSIEEEKAPPAEDASEEESKEARAETGKSSQPGRSMEDSPKNYEKKPEEIAPAERSQLQQLTIDKFLGTNNNKMQQ